MPKVSVRSKIQMEILLKRNKSFENRKKVSEALTGRKFTEEHKQKLREAKLKNPVKYWQGRDRENMTGSLNWKWRGDAVGYVALHSWINRRLGKANKCESKACSSDSLDFEWANISHKYLRDVTDWMSLCLKCHDKYDRSTKWGVIKERFNYA